jgi:hypothetical protein
MVEYGQKEIKALRIAHFLAKPGFIPQFINVLNSGSPRRQFLFFS